MSTETTQSHSPAAANEPPIAYLFRHNLWSNLRLFGACVALDEAQLDADVVGTYGKLHDTLTHIVIAEERYLALLNDASSAPPHTPGDTIAVAELRERVRTSGEGLIQVAAQVTSESIILAKWRDETHELPAVGILTQAINHATEHRAHVMTILTQQGIEPPDLSGWSFMDS